MKKVLINNKLLSKVQRYVYLVQQKVDQCLQLLGFIEQIMENIFYVNKKISKKENLLKFYFLVGDGTGCGGSVCELHLGNYTRHDPTIIECIADSEKSNRIAKVFNIDVFRKLID